MLGAALSNQKEPGENGRSASCEVLCDAGRAAAEYLYRSGRLRWHDIEMRAILPSARIIAFEAHPANFEHFSATVQHWRTGVDYVHCALSSTDGETTFNVLIRNDGTPVPLSKKSSLSERADGKRHKSVAVPARALDSCLRNSPGRCSLWIDVEGSAKEVLSGATETLARTVSVLIEVEEVKYWKDQWSAADVNSYMARHGLHPTARDYEYPQQYNLLFERRS